MGYEYDPRRPPGCPPFTSTPADATAYRFIKDLPIRPHHFLSDVEIKKAGHDPALCQCWGCSIWPSLTAAEHGRKIIPFFRKGYIAEGRLEPTDGEILSTPSPKQPDHVTFWKDQRIDVSGKFVIVLTPLHKSG